MLLKYINDPSLRLFLRYGESWRQVGTKKGNFSYTVSLLVGEVEARKPHYLVAGGSPIKKLNCASGVNCASDTLSRDTILKQVFCYEQY